MIEILITYFAATVLLFTTLWFAVQVKYFIYLRKVPGPVPLPLVGNALELTSPTVYLPKLLEYKKKYGGIFKLFLGFDKPKIVVSDQNFLAYVLSSTTLLDKADFYRFIQPWLGTGLITSTGTKWRKHRKLLTPAFHFQILERFLEIFESNAEILISKLRQHGGESLDVFPYISLCTLDIICESAMGIHFNAQKDSNSGYVTSTRNVTAIVMERLFSALKQNDTLYSFSDTYKMEKESLNILHSTALSVIQQRRSEEGKQTSKQEEDDGVGLKRRRALLDLLLASTVDGKPLSDTDIREEVDTFMFAGHDTTASTICFTLYNLSKHPEIQKKAVEELRTIFGTDKLRNNTFEDLRKMKYLEAVIKETLRLYPAVPFVGRTLTEDVEFDGTVYPKGVIFITFIFGIHRDPRFFPEPEKFDPDRFSDESLSREHPFVYIPFSAGPRNCIGQKYAMLEVKSIVSHILRHYEILPAIPHHEPILASESILRSANGVFIRIKDRVEE